MYLEKQKVEYQGLYKTFMHEMLTSYIWVSYNIQDFSCIHLRSYKVIIVAIKIYHDVAL